MTKDELAKHLLATFMDELGELVGAMNADLIALETVPTDAQRLKAVFRIAHTLKGASQATQQPMIAEVCHALEALLAEARTGEHVLGPDEFAMLFAAADALRDAHDRLRTKRELTGSPLEELRNRLSRAEFGRGAAGRPAGIEAGVAISGDATPDEGRSADVSRPPGPTDHFVRIESDKLDALVAASGQMLVASSGVAEHPEAIQALHVLARRTAAEWRRTGRQIRVALERSRAAPTLLHAVHSVSEGLDHIVHESGRLAARTKEASRALTQVTDWTADSVRRIRLRPLAEACDALPRAVRDLTAIDGKAVDLVVSGEGVEADRAVLDGLRDALLQLVRNAVDHGIEYPGERVRLGKSRRATVKVTGALVGGRLVVTVADDGAGLDIAGIRAQLERHGRPVPADEQDVANTLFAGGLSTRTEATTTSGRGVGLDIVRSSVQRIRGTVSVAWRTGQGTTFTIDCPPTLATVSALIVAIGSQLVAIPTSYVDRLVRVRSDQVRQAQGHDVILMSQGAPVPLVSLARLLPPLTERPPAESLSIVVLRSGGRRLAVTVDDLVSEQEIVSRPVWCGGQTLPGVSGAAILGSGRVVIVIDPVAAVAAGLDASPGSGLGGAGRAAAAVKRRILVVDDSITTRTLEQGILEAAGYDVEAAVDGADAWKLLQERGADLVVTDVEMPRMDGFALCDVIRRSKRFKTLPVVLVTALETTEHRQRGLDVGADAYLPKSNFDQQLLLEAVVRLLGEGER